MLNPNVHVMGEEGACIAYVRLTQFMDRNGEARTRQTQESRVWQKKAGRWKNPVAEGVMRSILEKSPFQCLISVLWEFETRRDRTEDLCPCNTVKYSEDFM
ncbi:hypothetical protein TELCIR_17707, partial [Teladorsagia circumcincta]